MANRDLFDQTTKKKNKFFRIEISRPKMLFRLSEELLFYLYVSSTRELGEAFLGNVPQKSATKKPLPISPL